MNLEQKLKELKGKYHRLTDQAREMLGEETPDLEAVKALNDDIEEVRAQITEVERTLTALQEQEAERQATEKAAEDEREAELEKRAEEKAKAMIKGLGIDRPDYTALEDQEDEPAPLPAHMQRIEVGSIYDDMGTLELATEFYVKSRAARVGAIQDPPSELMYRALCVRAAEFVQRTDSVPRFDRYGGVKMIDAPAFNPREYQREMGSRSDPDTWMVRGAQVKHNDNVTPNGIKSLWELGIKADELVYSTQASYGDEWVPTLMSAALWRRIRLDAKVLAALQQFDMPSQPYDYTKEGAGPTFYHVAETTDENQLVIGANMPVADSKVGTGKVTFTAAKSGAITFWSEEMKEDSIVATEPQLRDQFGTDVAHNVDYLLLNGDETTGVTTNISYYGATPAAGTRILAINGIRHEALVTTATDSVDRGVLTLEDVNSTRKLMGTSGINGSDISQLVMFCDPPTGMTFEDLDEVKTVDKYGANATVMRGELGSIKGIPIIKSEDYSLTYTNGNIHSTGTNNTKGSFVIVNRNGVMVGWRRRPRIYVGQIPFSDAWYILAMMRFDIGFLEAGMVGMAYNLSV
jgi:N4-gp56 family major capsid protein